MLIFQFEALIQDLFEKDPRWKNQIVPMHVLIDDFFFPRGGLFFCHIREHKGYLLVIILVNVFVDRQVQIHALHELFILRLISVKSFRFVNGKFFAIL